jgi:hypothetical protein
MTNLIGQLFTNGYIYLILYIWLFIVAILETCKEFTRYKIVFAFSTFVILALFTGLRWKTGTDWVAYKELFDDLKLDWTFIFNVFNFDLGYVLLNAFVRLFTKNYTLFLIIDSFIALSLIFVFLKKFSPYPNLSFFIFYNAYFVSQFMGSNRRMISLGAALFVFYFIYAKRKKCIALWETLAVLFHRTAIMALLAWFIPKDRISLKHALYLLIICFAVGIPQLPFKILGILGSYLQAYDSNPLISKLVFYSDAQGNMDTIPENINPVVLMTLSVIKRSIFLIYYFFIIYRKKGFLDPLTDFFFNIYIIGFAFYL